MTLLAEIFRGNYVENQVYGSFAVVNDQGKILDQQGDIETPIFARSAIKLLQALDIIESGAADRWHLTDEELVLACSSHHGEDSHIGIAERWTKKLNMDESNLYCGPHKPLNPEANNSLIRNGQPHTVLHNPCSGKHLGFLSIALHMEEPTEDYVSRHHPVQKRIEQTLNEMTSFETLLAPFGVDGCSAPAFSFPLYNLALGYARFGGDSPTVPYPRRQAAKRLLEAIRKHPQLMGGTKSFDTKVIETTQGKVITKVGACCILTSTIPEKGVGIALKIADGCNTKAAEVVMTHLLYKHHMISQAEYESLDPIRPVMSQAGHKVGEIRLADYT